MTKDLPFYKKNTHQVVGAPRAHVGAARARADSEGNALRAEARAGDEGGGVGPDLACGVRDSKTDIRHESWTFVLFSSG